MKYRKVITVLMLALLTAYILETERIILNRYPQFVEIFKSKVEPHLITLK